VSRTAGAYLAGAVGALLAMVLCAVFGPLDDTAVALWDGLVAIAEGWLWKPGRVNRSRQAR
jgi:hypothetical protein